MVIFAANHRPSLVEKSHSIGRPKQLFAPCVRTILHKLNLVWRPPILFWVSAHGNVKKIPPSLVSYIFRVTTYGVWIAD